MSSQPCIIELSSVVESRGNLTFLEEVNDLPFEIKRVYWLTEVPHKQPRGGHAHKTGHQVIVCIQGMVEVLLESENGQKVSFSLNQSNVGLYIPPQWWGEMFFKNEAILIGLASDEFSEADYIRNKADFYGET